MKPFAGLLLVTLVASPVVSVAAALPDLSGFWSPISRVIEPDPELATHAPRDAVVMPGTGPAEFGLMELGGEVPSRVPCPREDLDLFDGDATGVHGSSAGVRFRQPAGGGDHAPEGVTPGDRVRSYDCDPSFAEEYSKP